MFCRHTALRCIATLALGVLCTLGDVVWSQGQRGDGRPARTAWLDGHRVIEGEVLVRYRDTANGIERRRAEFEADADEVESVGRRGSRRMRSRRLTTQALMATLRNNPDVEFVEPNYLISVGAVPNDPSFASLWGLFNNGQVVNGQSGVAGADIRAVNAWNVSTGTRAIVVGVIDTGIDYNHPDLAANIWTAPRPFSVTIGGTVITCAAGTHGFNAILNTCYPLDDHAHGTHVAGTIGAVGNNGIGVTGVNWATSMMGLKFLSASGQGSTSDAIKAIEFAIQAHAVLGADADVRVLSNSWGGGGSSQSLYNQIVAAGAANMLFVAAAGNDATNNDAVPHYPSSYPTSNMISVAATTNRDQRAGFSNWGATSVHLGAPGQDIRSTVPNNGYQSFSGTSMATPQVSGAAALVLAVCPINMADLRSALLTTVDPIPAMAGITTTGGRLNVNTAINSCAPGPSSLNVASPSVTPGGTIQVTVQNGMGRPRDWIGLYAAAAGDNTFVDWKYLNGTQTAPSSGVTSTTLTFTAPMTTGTYNVRLFTNGYARLATSNTLTVTPTSSIRINDVSVVEGNSGTVAATFTVSVTPVNPAQTVTVSYATANGTALAGSDYAATSGTLTFNPGESTRQVTVLVNGDVVGEPSETFSVMLSNAINAVIGDAQGVGTITTDEAPPAPSVTVPYPTVFRGPLQLGLMISIANGPANPRDWVGIYAPGAPDGTFVDWFYTNGLKTLPAEGVSTTTIIVPPPAVDGAYHARFFTDGYTKLATSTSFTVSPMPTLSVGDVSVVEGNSGTVTASFTVTLQPASANTVTTTWATSNGTATSGSDYVAAGDTLTFAPGTTTRTIDVVVNGDAIVEPTETFTVSLVSSVGGAMLGRTGVGTIVNDDAAAAPSLTLNTTTVAPGGNVQLTVANGPGGTRDWVAIYQSGAADTSFVDWYYLNGLKTAPTAGVVTTTFTVPAPSAPGTYGVRLFANGYTKLATSADFTVGSVTPPPGPSSITLQSASVTPGGTITLDVTDASGNARDWIGLYTSGAADGAFMDWMYLNGSKTAPATAVATARLQMTGPSTLGMYHLRLFTAGYTRLATSADFTVTSTVAPGPGPSLTVVTTTVARGGLIQVTLSNGPAGARDWIGVHQPAAIDGVFDEWTYLNGSKTAPTTGVANGTVMVPAPMVAGVYHLRLFTNGYNRLATSATVTVLP